MIKTETGLNFNICSFIFVSDFDIRILKFLVIFTAFTFIIFLGCRKKGEEQIQVPSESKPPAYGDTFVDGSIGDASNLIPILSSDSASHDIASLIYNGLVKYDKDLNLVGDLAESWQISPDGLVITFKLRMGITWHDGKPFTAHDCLFTYQVIVDPKTPTAYAEDFKQVKKATVIDDYTFQVYYGKPFAPALASWGMAMLPRHLLEGKDITKSPLSRHPIGTGPYWFKEWTTAEKIVLEANPEYFEGRTYIGRYIYRVIPDSATLFLELKARSIDRMGLTPMQYVRQTESPEIKTTFKKYRYLSFSYTYLGYNLLNPLFKDKRVRQAITYAIDRQEIIDGVLLGLGKIATGPYKPETWQYNPAVKNYPYDVKKAKAFLAEAGWKDTNGDGIVEKDGKDFQFTILTNQGNDVREKCAEIIQRRLKEAGIDVKIRIVEWATFIKEFINKRTYEAVILGWTIPQDPDLYDIWHSSKTKPDELNFISYKNAEVDELLEKGRRTFNQEERRRCYYRIQEILAEDQPYTFLFVPDALPIIHARFRGIEPAPAGINYNFIKWYVPKDEQKYILP
jgi:peptide/nickel transport system substrate-binding protein